MASTNSAGHSTGFISIPVEIVSRSNLNNSNFYDPPNRTTRYENSSHSDFSNSPPWKKPSINTYYRSRLQPRQTVIPAYDRLINDFPLHQSYHEQQYRPLQKRTYDSSSLHTSRSSDDLLSSSNDSIRPKTQSSNASYYHETLNNGFPTDSDFIYPNTYTNSFRRSSFDVLNDVSDINQQNPSEHQTYYRPTYITQTNINPKTVYSNEYHIPINNYQSSKSQETANNSHDRSGSPASDRDESPTRPSPLNAQQPQESDFKVTKDATSTMTGPITSSSSNDQQVPSTEMPAVANLQPVPLRDPNTIALEKLEQIKQNLVDLNQQVDAFDGVTRDDRVYKLLDEQAVKMMLTCDELTDVSIDIKEKRKEMIRNVQTVIAKLESKVPMNATIENNSNLMETKLTVDDLSINSTEQQQSSRTQNEQTSTERPT
ncbi:unnamed protein product [Rotaria magnacalcarata]|uniref:BAG domain-containing protein n=1 Tax=Rotaria magnacalcarata TaxID=392030 RepID=A0A819J4S8_9BILA|nr:unnamed protein product [Rotaria magnacalcarata]CAF2197126.1 unnamed protein product [Rotaria magnacalcarata]CAF3906763.1 unnamed protein product [Rotaria magnacalcarata]CAF3927426.1 unnamed protein product [Rotaria magnacalcarata]